MEKWRLAPELEGDYSPLFVPVVSAPEGRQAYRIDIVAYGMGINPQEAHSNASKIAAAVNSMAAQKSTAARKDVQTAPHSGEGASE